MSSSAYPPFGAVPAGPCQRCGMPRSTNELVCRNCGYQHVPVSGNTGQLHAAWGKVLPPTYGSGRPWSVSSPTDAFPQLSFSPPASPQGTTSAPNHTRPVTGQMIAMPGLTQAQSGRFQQQDFLAMPLTPETAGGFSPLPTRSRRRGNPLLIVVLLSLIVVVAGGGWLSYNQFIASKSAQTPQAQPIVAAPTAPQKPPIFADTFKDNANGWSTQSISGKFSASVGKGALMLENSEHKMLWEAIPNNGQDKTKPYGNFSDFKLLVDATLAKGDQSNGYGLFVRGTIDQVGEMASYYRFGLYCDGTYAVFKGAVDANGKYSATKLVDYKKNAAIHAGNVVNHLSLTIKGSSMIFAVNSQVLETINDSSYKSGVIALFVINLQEAQGGAQAQFVNLGIYPSDV